MRALHRHAANGATVAAGVEGWGGARLMNSATVADDVQEEGGREEGPVGISIKLNVVHPGGVVSEPEKRRSPATTSIVPLNPTML